MTTVYNTSGPYSHGSDAAFQTWITALHNLIVGCGLVQTSDTGQLDFATAARPGATNTMAGFRMYRFNDSLQATAPIFIKLFVGNGASTVGTSFGWQIAIGIATDGAGGLVAPITAGTIVATKGTATYGVGTNGNFACHTAGAAWIAFQQKGISDGAIAAFAVFRTCGDDGLPTGEGCTFYAHTGNNGQSTTSVHSLRFEATAAVIGSNTFLPTLIPLAVTDSHVGIDIQIFPHWSMTRRVRQNPFAFSYMNSELTNGVAISAAPFAGLTHTYMPLQGYTMGANPVASNGHGNALIWE